MNQNTIVIPTRKEIFGWAMYDFANSAFATTISSVVFNVYFTKVIVGDGGAVIFGHNIPASSLWGYTVSLSILLVVFTAPILGAIADFSGTKKRFLFLYCYLACLFTGLLFFAEEGDYIFAMIFYMLANYCFAGSLGFYNAFLPEISTKENIGRISGFGWAIGFIGGGILLAINLVMIRNPQLLGIPDEDNLPVRFVILSVAIWWAVFSIPIFLFVRGPKTRGDLSGWKAVTGGARQLISTFQEIRKLRVVFLFLIGYWLYIDGVDTIIRMAVDYGMSIGLDSNSLILALLITQFIGFPAAIAFGKIGEKLGTKTGIFIGIGVYIGVTVWSFFMKREIEFYALAIAIGLVQGGVQSLSRSFYTRLIPENKAAEFFGFYNMLGKFAAVIGPALIGWLSVITHSPRYSILSIIVLFISGAVILYFVNEKEGHNMAKELGKI